MESFIHDSGINPSKLRRYLVRNGWSESPLSSTMSRFILRGGTAGDDLEVALSFGTKSEARDLKFALVTLAQLSDRSVSEVISEVRLLTFDVITSRIPDAYVSSDSIQLRIASEYIEGMRRLLAASAAAEISGARHTARMLGQAVDYSDSCRFGHTFRGSFGFKIESPVGLNDEPSLIEEVEDVPLGRAAVERIARGFSSIMKAESLGSSQEIVAEVQGLSSNMCTALVELIDEVSVSHIHFGISFSPEWHVRSEGLLKEFSLCDRHTDILVDAAAALRSNDKPKMIRIVGRIKSLSTLANPSDLFVVELAREVVVVWINDDSRAQNVRMFLSPEQYIIALDAHKKGQLVTAGGMLVRSGKSWMLEAISHFQPVPSELFGI